MMTERIVAVAQTGHTFVVTDDSGSVRTVGQLIELLLKLYIPASAPRRASCSVEILLPGRESLAPDQPLPEGAGVGGGSDDDPLFVFANPEWAAYFPPPPRPPTPAMLDRQADACRMLMLPLMAHWRTVSEYHALVADRVLPDAEAQLAAVESKLPQTLEALRSVPVVGEDGKTLLDKVDGADRRMDELRGALRSARAEVTQSAARLAEVEARIEQVKGLIPPAAVPTTSAAAAEALHEQLTAAVNSRLAQTKALLRDLEKVRQIDKKVRSLADVVRGGARLHITLQSLPEAYTQAHLVARQRLTLRRAARRVLGTLQREADRINAVVRDFKATIGERFPSNLLPGIERPVKVDELPLDHVAALLEPHEPDTDEDPASELLVRLGLSPAASAADVVQLQGALQALRVELDAAQAAGRALLRERDAARADADVLRQRLASAVEEVGVARAAAAQAAAAVENARAEAAAAQAAAAAAATDVAEARAALAAAQTAPAEAPARVTAAASASPSLPPPPSAEQAALIETLRAAFKEAQREAGVLRDDKEQLAARFASIAAEKENLEMSLEAAQSEIAALRVALSERSSSPRPSAATAGTAPSSWQNASGPFRDPCEIVGKRFRFKLNEATSELLCDDIPDVVLTLYRHDPSFDKHLAAAKEKTPAGQPPSLVCEIIELRGEGKRIRGNKTVRFECLGMSVD